ncbi:dethiobiotin synthase [Corynebacterium sp. 320]|uniref:ATP-dependent dethiobiotin synthetase BioD n=1 Tax=Corynebacterium TaxID=1716 RepID=UPI00125CBA86|nr:MULTISPECIES: dethiobiotin synthase [Corynebacterium]KAB1503895.1 dethiobiotin synthase [Corynebacterium sp. 320]KAB1553006.1 dethiobiotin synthase [Corynebacterium sp. 321]KAB1553774.1 dethiobiotin synthase [Corynebacterium sp. 319]KAB3528031.1 dethiobiotin synthase [Corynebacterium sp. 250]KAB3540480.1 dethiobiotin synthase [Corynebacterium sp. 366]
MIVAITGTGTDVGKTVATAALASHIARAHSDGLDGVHIVKLAQTGEPVSERNATGDAATIAALTGARHVHELARYPDPLAPLDAAVVSGRPPLRLSHALVRIEEIHAAAGEDGWVLIEGAGGLLVNIGLDDEGDAWTMADLASALSIPIIVVTTTGLGSLNAAALTLEALSSRGVQCAGLIGGSVPQDLSGEKNLATRITLQHFSSGAAAPWLGALPAGAGALPQEQFLSGNWLKIESLLENH